MTDWLDTPAGRAATERAVEGWFGFPFTNLEPSVRPAVLKSARAALAAALQVPADGTAPDWWTAHAENLGALTGLTYPLVVAATSGRPELSGVSVYRWVGSGAHTHTQETT